MKAILYTFKHYSIYKRLIRKNFGKKIEIFQNFFENLQTFAKITFTKIAVIPKLIIKITQKLRQTKAINLSFKTVYNLCMFYFNDIVKINLNWKISQKCDQIS